MRLWSSLSKRTKRRYTSQGVGAATYNAWNRKPAKVRREIRKQYPDAKSGPQSAVKAKLAKVKPSPTPAEIAAYAASFLPGDPKSVERVVRANSVGMTKEDRDRAVGIRYTEWQRLAADQSRNNPWFYHAINPGAKVKGIR